MSITVLKSDLKLYIFIAILYMIYKELYNGYLKMIILNFIVLFNRLVYDDWTFDEYLKTTNYKYIT